MCERGHKNGHEFVSNSNEDLMVFTIYKVSYRSSWWVGGGGREGGPVNTPVLVT